MSVSGGSALEKTIPVIERAGTWVGSARWLKPHDDAREGARATARRGDVGAGSEARATRLPPKVTALSRFLCFAALFFTARKISFHPHILINWGIGAPILSIFLSTTDEVGAGVK